MMGAEEEDPQTRVLQEISSMIVQILRYPFPVTLPFPDDPSSSSSSSSIRRSNTTSLAQISTASFASLFLGISLALMLFGLVTFLIGFILMPWVIGLVLIFYFVGVVSNLSELGRAFLCWALAPPPDVHAWKYS